MILALLANIITELKWDKRSSLSVGFVDDAVNLLQFKKSTKGARIVKHFIALFNSVP
jgi:hypothetical protein